MKAKKSIGLIAFASACVSLSALGNTTNGWFGVTVEGTTATPVNITKNDVGTVEDSKIKLADVDQTTPLVFTPTEGTVTNLTDGIYVIGASVALTPCSTNDLKATDGAKAGIVAGIDAEGVTNYYGYAGGNWYKLNGATVVAEGADTTFRIVLNYRDDPKKVSFCIVENEDEISFGPYDMITCAETALTSIQAWGTGSISSVTGGFEVAEAQYDGKRYGSVADAMSAAGDSANYNNIAVVNEQGTAEPTDVKDANDLYKWQNKAMGIASDGQVGLAKSAGKQNADMITLDANLQNKEDGVVVMFDVYCNGSKVGGPYAENNIQIPMGSSVGTATYTIVPVIGTTK